MALVPFPGAPAGLIGPNSDIAATSPNAATVTIDAANEAVMFIGHCMTSDEGSHTINTTGSSSIGWRSSGVTFASVSSTVKVGIASVLTTVGPPGRAVNASDVITFDVSKTLTGGGGGIPSLSWQTHVPDSGTKTIAHGDLIAICIQMTARGGTDALLVAYSNATQALHRPVTTTFLGAVYAAVSALPNAVITFSDGAIGYLQGSDICSTMGTRTWNNTQATKEYGQLYAFNFPMKIYGAYGWIDPDADFDVVLYSDPLGTPIAERTASVDANIVSSTNARRFNIAFSSPYTTTAGTPFAIVFKPGAVSMSAYYKTLNAATHRVADVWGTSGYGISRASGAFANANSSLDHYYIGLVAGAFNAGGAATRDNMFLVMQ